MKLFEWAARHRAEIIFLSSSAIYGIQEDLPIREDASLRPNTIYAVCKESCEHFLRILEEGYGLKWTVLRLFATYGAGHKPSNFQGIINILMTQMLGGKDVIVKGSLLRKRGLIDVEDAVRAIIMAVENSKARGEIINISHSAVHTISDLIDIIAEALDKKRSDFNIVEEDGTVGDTFYNYANTLKAKNILGFEASIDIKYGVAKMLKTRLERGA
jgi:UDP-glucose 4-epimerase